MDLESNIQSEVSQNEKNKQRVLMHICGIQKNGTDEPLCRTRIEMQMQKTDCGHDGGGGGMNWEIRINIYTLPHVKQISSGNLLYSAGNSARASFFFFFFSVMTQMGRGEGGQTCTHTADSLLGIAETNTNCKATMCMYAVVSDSFAIP